MTYFLFAISGFVLGCGVMYLIFRNILKSKERQLQYNKRNYDMVNQWLILKDSGMGLSKEIKRYGVHRIAIYGMGICGRHLVRELQHSDIEIAYAMDRKVVEPYQGVEIRKLKEGMPEVDAVINTVINGSQSLKDLKQHYKCRILGLETLVFESYLPDKGNK